MGNELSLDMRLKELMRKKLAKYNCNPCTCEEQTKEIYFLELKDIVKRYNMEEIASYIFQNQFTKSMNPHIH